MYQETNLTDSLAVGMHTILLLCLEFFPQCTLGMMLCLVEHILAVRYVFVNGLQLYTASIFQEAVAS